MVCLYTSIVEITVFISITMTESESRFCVDLEKPGEGTAVATSLTSFICWIKYFFGEVESK